jgi:hypothetical protein
MNLEESVLMATDILELRKSKNYDILFYFRIDLDLINVLDSDVKMLPVNPIVAYFSHVGKWWRCMISFKTYPSKSFPNVVFDKNPSCPEHLKYEHPNISRKGILRLPPHKIAKNEYKIKDTVELVMSTLNNPYHRNAVNPHTKLSLFSSLFRFRRK